MEKQFNRVPMLSLQELSLRRLAILLWNAPCNLLRVINYRYRSGMEYGHVNLWNENFSNHTLSKLLLMPESLAKQLERISKPIGLEMLNWKVYHEAYLNTPQKFCNESILGKLQWTAAGAVDYRKTAEELLGCDILDIVKRYKLACLYCLDRYIPELWEELPRENKVLYYKKGASRVRRSHLVYFWPYILKGEDRKLTSFNLNVFHCSSYQGNKTAAEYFFQKLTPEKREISLEEAADYALAYRSSNVATYPSSFPNKNISDLVFYLLSEMTPEQQVRVLRERPADIFGCFFDWPWQDAFFGFADTLWTCMQSEDLARRARNYNTLLGKMQRSIRRSDCHLPDFFQNIFMSSPSDFKKNLVEQELVYYTCLFKLLFDNRDAETIKVILSHLDAEDRLRLASSKRMLNLFYSAIWNGAGHLVEVFLGETRLSREDKLRLKKDLVGELKSVGRIYNPTITITSVESITPSWRKFFEFLDETENQLKRNSDVEPLTEVKKLCCEKK